MSMPILYSCFRHFNFYVFLLKTCTSVLTHLKCGVLFQNLAYQKKLCISRIRRLQLWNRAIMCSFIAAIVVGLSLD